MILELADIRIHPGQQAAFEKAIELGLNTVACKAKGFQGGKVNRGIESPERYVLQIFGTPWKTTPWASVNHPFSRNGVPSWVRFLLRLRTWNTSS
jgi:hypothetical protein